MAEGGPAGIDPAATGMSIWRQRLVVAAPVVMAVGLAVLFWPGSDGDPEPPSEGIDAEVTPVDVVAAGPTLATVEELLAAGDVVVVGVIAATEPGRAITDPQDPTTGIRTSLFDLVIEEILVGVGVAGAETIVVEHETALLDGTPITVNGIGPPTVGQRGLYVLVSGSSPAFPHAALASPEAWALLDGGRLFGQPGTSADHPLVGLTIEELRVVANG